MNSRNSQSVRFVTMLFLALLLFDASCGLSRQANRRRPAARGSRDRGSQGNLGQQYRQLLLEMKSKGHDVSEAEGLSRRARAAVRQGNRREANTLLREAIAKLEALKTQTSPTRKQPSKGKVGKSVQITLPVNSKVRVIKTIPWDTKTVSNNVLQNFRYSELEPKNKVILLNINSPVIVQEYPYSDFKFQNNAAFGSTESGQLNISLRGISKSAQNQRQGTIISILSQAGLGVARDFRFYDTLRCHVEARQGIYDFSLSDYAVNAAIEEGLSYIGRVTPHHEVMKAGPLEDERSYIAYVKRVVTQYKGRIKYWQTLKEPDPRMEVRGIKDGGLSPEDAVLILRLSYTAIKSIDKDACVYFPGTGPHYKYGGYTPDSYLEKIISLGGAKYFDVMGINAYTRDIEESARKYRDMLKKHGYQKPIWVAQTGVPDHEPARPVRGRKGGSLEGQCIHMVTAYAKAFSIGIEKVFWGEFLDESKAEGKNRIGRDKTGNSLLAESQGLFYTGSWEKKPAYFTHRLLASALYDFTKAERIAANIVKFTFSSKSPVYIVWPMPTK